MDKAAMIDKLNEILKWEYAGVVQYTQYSFLLQDTWRQVFYEEFRESGQEGLTHAHLVGDKIVALGGVTTVERGDVKVTHDLQEMLRNSLDMELRLAQLYTEAVSLCTDREVGLRNLLEDICQQEQDAADHLAKILKQPELSLNIQPKLSQKAG